MTTWDDLVSAGLARREVMLAPLTTYKLGGPADLYVEASNPETLEAVGETWRSHPLPVLVLGRGSNLVVSDHGFRGVVLRLGASFDHTAIDAEGIVTAGGAGSLPRLARATAGAGRGGLEWGVGIPGSVGGAVRQNAGCFGWEVVDRLVEAEVVSLRTGRRRWKSGADLDLGYRHSNVAPTEVVVTARFATAPVAPAVAAEEMRRITTWRRQNQPGGTLNAGSVFKNPPGGEAAGAIIDSLGLKGFGSGAVRVSPRHANFIEATREAAAADVRRLVLEVAERVFSETGIRLEPEIQFVGFDGE